MNEPHSRKTPLHALLWLLIIGIIAADQLSKAYFVFRLGTHHHHGFLAFMQEYFSLWGPIHGLPAVTDHYTPIQPYISVWEPWIRFSLTMNTGAAWSIFEGNSFALSFVSLIMAVLLYFVWWKGKGYRYRINMTLALGAIIGGALGNYIDRFRLKEVVDFIAVKIPYIGKLIPGLGDPYDFPIFNIADSAAVCGTLALATYLVLADIHSWGKHKPKPSPKAETSSPWTPALSVDSDALEELRFAAANAPRYTAIGMTMHIGLPAAVSADPAAEEETREDAG